MAIGERIKFFRTRAGMTMNYLGRQLGFSARSADVRIAQYENNSRKPKADLTTKMATVFGVRPEALDVPDIDNPLGLLHTLFALEDIYGLTIDELDGLNCLRIDAHAPKEGVDFQGYLETWYIMKDNLAHGRITREEYDNWRYNYPSSDYINRPSRVSSHTP